MDFQRILRVNPIHVEKLHTSAILDHLLADPTLKFNLLSFFAYFADGRVCKSQPE